MTPADTARANGWTVGTHLAGDEGYGVTVIRITAIGEDKVLAREVMFCGVPIKGGEHSWTFEYRDWQEVPTPTPPEPPQ